MKRSTSLLMAFMILCAFNYADSPLKGVWEYRGGIFNGKLDSASSAYKLQRTYDDLHYQAKVMEKGEKTVIYEKGDYSLNSDTCFETQTYCMQASKLLNRTVKFNYVISNDTLKLRSVLSNGNKVVDYWVRVK